MKPKRGRKPLPPDKRKVRLLGSGPFVKPETQALISAWGKLYGISAGTAIDNLLAFARERPEQFRLEAKRGHQPKP